MPSRRPIITLLAGGAVLAPLLAFGHACEFLAAGLQVTPAGEVELQITADYGGNPMIADEEAARAAVLSILRVEHGGRTSALGDVAPLRIERRSQWDPATPASFSPPPDGQEHQLITATWRWRPDAPEIRFKVPDGSHHDVLLWRREADPQPGAETKWTLMIAGDQSPVIVMPQKNPGPAMLWGGIAGLCLILMLLVPRLRGRRPRPAPGR